MRNFDWFKTITYYVDDKVDEFIRVYDGNRYLIYLILFVPEKKDVICNRIRLLISQESGIYIYIQIDR